MNPKALQYITGHANINMTLNYYAHTMVWINDTGAKYHKTSSYSGMQNAH